MNNEEKMVASEFYPLRPMQRWLIDTHFEKAKSTMMNIGGLLEIDVSIDMKRLADSINIVLNRHDIFRCQLTIDPETSDICQKFNAGVQKVFVEKISDEEFKNRILKLKEPYQLIDKPLYRIYLLETPTVKYAYLDFYHAIMDGMAITILFWREVEMAYNGKIFKKPAQSYAEYILEEKNISPENLEEGRNYWNEIVRRFDLKKHILPYDVEEGENFVQNEMQIPLKNISRNFFKKKNFAEDTFFTAAVMLTIAKIIGVKESFISYVHNGRTTSKELRLMGIMIESYPVYCDFNKYSTVGELLQALKSSIGLGIKYRKSLDTVYSKWTENEPLTFIMQKDGGMGRRGIVNLADTKAKIIDMPENNLSAAESPLDIEINEWNENDGCAYLLLLDYDESRYSENFMTKFAETIDEIIFALQDENKKLSEIL